MRCWVALVASTLSIAISTGALATIGGVGDCSDAAGQLKLDIAHDGVLRSAAPQPSGSDAPSIPFKEQSRIVLERRVSSCVSKNCGQAFKVESERFIMLIEWQEAGQKTRTRTHLYCEYAWDASPANCSCDREVQQEHRVLVPTYRNVGKGSR